MSEREPTYIVLDWNEDFKLDAHIDATGQQRVVLTGYIQKRRADGVYQAPLIPQLFFGVNGTQLDTWSQYLTAGDHTVLRRDSGNPTVPDHELYWSKVRDIPPRGHPQPTAPTPVTLTTLELPWYAWLLVPLGIGFIIAGYYLEIKPRRKRSRKR